MEITTVFTKIMRALDTEGVRYVDSCGGTRSGKTYAALQMLIYLCNYDTVPTINSVVSESVPHLKRGAIRDFREIMEHEDIWVRSKWHDGDKIYTFDSGSKLEFFSADTPAKVHGPARDRLFINEGQNIAWEVVRQLFVRTRGIVLIDYNPTSEFWVHDHIRGRENAVTIHSTYKDNPFLSKEQIAEIESNRNDAAWWQVYGEGKTGNRQGLVYPDWQMCDFIPLDARFVGRGVDFGFVADPTAIVDVYLSGGSLYFDEQLYRKGMTNDQIADELKRMPPAPVTVADSAEMKSITEIRNYGVRFIEPSIKGQGSVVFGIDVIKRYPLYITRGSLNLIKELRNYMWKADKLTGEISNEPVDKYNHLLDAARYVVGNVLAEKPKAKRPTIRLTNID